MDFVAKNMNKEDWQKKGEGHRQRLRDKFLDKGLDGFSDAEVIELLLALGTPRKDCKESARAALDHFGTLVAVLDAPAMELQKTKGIGPKNSFAIGFVQAVARRYLEQRLTGKDYLHSSREVSDYLIHLMRDMKREVFIAIFLDASHGIIDSQIVAEGTIASNTIYPRELIKLALSHNAAALVVAHNHPSGNLTPSEADIQLTRQLFMACGYMNIQLLDHLIVGSSERPYSFADHGQMLQIQEECRQLL